MQVKRHCKYFAFLLVILCAAVMLTFNEDKNQKEQYINTRQYVTNLAQQASEWMRSASTDVSPLMQNMHANYAVSLFFALKHALNDEVATEILKEEGYDLQSLRELSVKIQEQAVKNMTTTCARVKPNTETETSDGKESSSTMKQTKNKSSFTPVVYPVRK